MLRDGFRARGDTLQGVFLLGALLFLAAEVAAFAVVGIQIGFLWAVVLLIGLSALGPFAIRRVGLGVLARTQRRLAAGELPTRELLDGVLVLGGGVMICLPGFIGGVLGLLLMVGAVRDVVVRGGGYWLGRQVKHMASGRRMVTDVESRPAAPIAAASLTAPPPRMAPGEQTDD
jgi:UPF0716 protein FxsA